MDVGVSSVRTKSVRLGAGVIVGGGGGDEEVPELPEDEDEDEDEDEEDDDDDGDLPEPAVEEDVPEPEVPQPVRNSVADKIRILALATTLRMFSLPVKQLRRLRRAYSGGSLVQSIAMPAPTARSGSWWWSATGCRMCR